MSLKNCLKGVKSKKDRAIIEGYYDMAIAEGLPVDVAEALAVNKYGIHIGKRINKFRESLKLKSIDLPKPVDTSELIKNQEIIERQSTAIADSEKNIENFDATTSQKVLIKKDTKNNQLLDYNIDFLNDPNIREKVDSYISSDFIKSAVKDLNLENTINAPYISSIYSNAKYNEARDGAIGIGSFATLGTLLSMLPHITAVDPDTNLRTKFDLYVRKQTKNGKPTRLSNLGFKDKKHNNISEPKVADGSGRLKLEVNSQFLNASLDNGNEPLLGLINANSDTFPVIQAMIALGYNENQIITFITHEGVTDYLKAVTAMAVDEKYRDPYSAAFASRYNKDITDIDEGVEMSFEDLKEGNVSNQDVVIKFLEFKEVANGISRIKRDYNIDSSGIPKSILNVFDHIYNMSNTNVIVNADKIEESDLIIKAAVNYGLKTTMEIFGDLFPPYRLGGFVQTAIKQIQDMKGNGYRVSDKRKQTILNFYKNFNYADAINFTELVNNSPKAERMRLMRSVNNIGIKTKAAKEKYPDNPFLAALDIIQDEKRNLTVVQFNNASRAGVDEEYIHLAFEELLNNTETEALAKDLVLFTYLTDANIRATSYVRYIPHAYISGTGLAKALRLSNESINNNEDVAQARFIKQLVQHNPGFAYNIGDLEVKQYIKGKEKEIIIPDIEADFISYNIEGTWFLYQRQERNYVRIPVLGNKRTHEIDNKRDLLSIFPDQNPLSYQEMRTEDAKVDGLNAKQKTSASFYTKINISSYDKLINSLDNLNIPEQLKPLLPILKTGLQKERPKIVIAPAAVIKDGVTTPGMSDWGRYEPSSNTIMINDSITTEEDLARVIMHESMHYLTMSAINNADTKIKRELKAGLDGIRSNYKKRLIEEYGQEAYDSYKEKRKRLDDSKTDSSIDPTSVQFDSKTDMRFYAADSLVEFAVLVFEDVNVRKDLEKMSFNGTKTLYQRLLDIFKKYVKALGFGAEDNALTEAVTTVLNIIQTQASPDEFIETDNFSNIIEPPPSMENNRQNQLDATTYEEVYEEGEPTAPDNIPITSGITIKGEKSTPQIEIITEKYSRDSLDKDSNSMYIFTDNAERTSRPTATSPNITEGWYAEKYKNETNKPLHYGSKSNPTSAVIRGKNNAYPISTMSAYGTNWTNDNFDLFKATIDDEINQIKKDLPKFKMIKIGNFRIGQGGRFAKLPAQHQAYLDSKLLELSIDNSGKTPKIVNGIQGTLFSPAQVRDRKRLKDDIDLAIDALVDDLNLSEELTYDEAQTKLRDVNKLLTTDMIAYIAASGESKFVVGIKANLEGLSSARIKYKYEDLSETEKAIYDKLTSEIKVLSSRIPSRKQIISATGDEKVRLEDLKNRLTEERQKKLADREAFLQSKSYNTLYQIGKKQIQDIRNKLDTNEIGENELVQVITNLKVWSQMLNDAFDPSLDPSEFEGNQEYEQLVELQSEADSLIKAKIQPFLRRFVNEIRQDLNISTPIETKLNDVDILTAWFKPLEDTDYRDKDGSVRGSGIAQVIAKAIKLSDVRSKNESVKVFSEIDKVSGDFKEKFGDDLSWAFREDGNLLDSRNTKYWDEKNKLINKKNALLAKGIGIGEQAYKNVITQINQFEKKANEVFDLNRLFKINEETGEITRDIETAYYNILVSKYGKVNVDNGIDSQEAKITKYYNELNKLVEDSPQYLNYKKKYNPFDQDRWYNNFMHKEPALEYREERYYALANKPEYLEYLNWVKSMLKDFYAANPDDASKLHQSFVPQIPKTLVNQLKSSSFLEGGKLLADNIKSFLTESEYNLNDFEIDILTEGSDMHLVFGISNKQDEIKKFTPETYKRRVNNSSKDLQKILKIVARKSITYKHKKSVEDKIKLARVLFDTVPDTKHTKKGQRPWYKPANNLKTQIDYTIASFYGVNEGNKKLNWVRKKKTYTEEEKKEKVELEKALAEAVAKKKVDDIAIIESRIDTLGSHFTSRKAGRAFLNYVQVLGMGFNTLSAISNQTFAFFSNSNHAAGGEDFNMGDFMAANKLVMSSVANLVPGIGLGAIAGTIIAPGLGTIIGGSLGALLSGDIKFNNTSKKINALMKQFHALGDIIDINDFDKDYYKERKSLFDKLSPYELQRKSEYAAYATTLMSMMLSKKVAKSLGLEVPLYEVYELVTTDTGSTIKIKPEYKDKVTSKVEEDFKLRLDEVNRMIHGNYDASASVQIKGTIAGQAIMQFKSWVPDGVSSRFGGLRSSDALDRHVIGRYRLIKETWDMILKRILKQNNPSLDALKDYEIAAINKNINELLTGSAILALAIILKAQEDEDDEDQYLLRLAYNSLIRWQDDMTFYVNPMSVQQVISVPALSVLKRYYTVSDQAIRVIFDDDADERTQNALLNNTLRLIPGGGGVSNLIRASKDIR